MRGCVAVLGFLLSFPVFPQCSWSPRASAQFRTTALDVAVQDSFVWLATGYGVTLIDANTLRMADAVALPGSTRVIYADPRGVAYAGSGSRLYVLARNGHNISVVRAVDAGGTVNDIAAAGSYLFVGTSNGLAHFDALEATNPLRAPNMLPTTATNVTSVAVSASKLYAADNDFTVDVFSITIPSLPQRTGELTSLSRAAAVHAAGDNVYVSDAAGQNTDVFTGATRTARLGVGTNAFAAFANGVHFAAGIDYTLRAIDFTSTATVKEVYEHSLAPIGGNDFVIHEIVRANDKLYVAAGDIGLAVYDVATLGAPYPIAAYRTSITTSTVMSGDRAWFADANGTITEAKIAASGLTLTTERTWSGGSLVHDVDGANLLTSNGSEAKIWSLSGAAPVQTQSTTFGGAVKAARLYGGDNMVALLTDGSVWIGGASPQKLALPKMAYLDRAGTTYTFAELRDATTVLHRFATSDFSATPVQHTIAGITNGLDTTTSRMAVYTFSGLRVLNADGSTHATLQLPLIPRAYAFSGNDLLVFGDRTLYVYEGAQTLVRTHALPANVIGADAAPAIASVATSEGMMAVSYLGTAQPAPVVPFKSRFYSKVVAAGERAYLFDRDGIDVFSTASGELPRYVTTVSAAGILDIAATPNALFTLSANGTVVQHSPQGVAMLQSTLNEGSDMVPLAIDVAGNAIWVSISKGCLSGGCQNKTLVLNPATLSVTASMNGAVADVVTANDRAYALFELPNEVRTINILDPLQPQQLLAINAPNRATSVAAKPGSVFVAGDRLYEYVENTLVLKSAYLPAISPDKAQQVRIVGNCLLLTARNANPETYNATTIIPAPPQYDVPSPVRGVAMLPGKLLLLTTHSLEVWSSTPPDNPKRRSAR